VITKRLLFENCLSVIWQLPLLKLQHWYQYGHQCRFCLKCKFDIGAHGARETPVPMPNTEVKPSSGYNTWVLALGK
jgi:hypothetical protein